MTERLYYTNPYQRTFRANVLSCEGAAERYEAILDRTAFYPTSGGQPYDLGRLGDASVQEVIERNDDHLVHVIDRAIEPGVSVEGEIDWPRRFDHMQQHTGQHVLSAAFDRLYANRTQSFHLGAASATIDLAREASAEEIRAAEDESNRIVWEDRIVHIRFASEEEARTLPLRKESTRTGPLRLIDITDFDLSACGGTHVSSTGAVGMIAVAGWEKFRGGSRIEFLCGGRALARFRLWSDALSATTERLSVQPADLAGAVEKLQTEAKTLQKTIRAQQEQLARFEARALVSRGTRVGPRVLVIEALEGWDAAGLKALAAAVTSLEAAAAVALFNRTPPFVAVIAAGAAAGIDAAATLKDLVATFGGKGGGKRDLAQGGGFAASHDELALHARAVFERGSIV